MKRVLLLISLLIITTISNGQNKLVGKVELCGSCRETILNDSVGYIVKTSASKTAKLKTLYLKGSYKLYRNSELLVEGDTDKRGNFQISGLQEGPYMIAVQVVPLLKTDTTIFVHKANQKVKIILDDKMLYAYLDSLEFLKFPYSSETAKQDIARGDIKILTAGYETFADINLDSLTKAYGFRYENVAGCLVNKYISESMSNYNSEVYKYLDNINQQGWKDDLFEKKTRLLNRTKNKK